MGFVGFLSIMPILHVLHVCASFSCIVPCLCCVVHITFMIKTSLRCVCMSLWILWNTNVVGLIMFL